MRTYLWDDRLRAVTQYGKTQNCSKIFIFLVNNWRKRESRAAPHSLHLNDCQPFSVILFLDEQKIELFSHLGICIQVIPHTHRKTHSNLNVIKFSKMNGDNINLMALCISFRRQMRQKHLYHPNWSHEQMNNEIKIIELHIFQWDCAWLCLMCVCVCATFIQSLYIFNLWYKRRNKCTTRSRGFDRHIRCSLLSHLVSSPYLSLIFNVLFVLSNLTLFRSISFHSVHTRGKKSGFIK